MEQGNGVGHLGISTACMAIDDVIGTQAEQSIDQRQMLGRELRPMVGMLARVPGSALHKMDVARAGQGLLQSGRSDIALNGAVSSGAGRP